MFKFLKDKLKKAVAKFSKEVDEEAEEIPAEEIVEEVKEEEPKEEPKEEVVDEPKAEEPLEEEPEEEIPEEIVSEEELKEVKKEPETTAEPESEPEPVEEKPELVEEPVMEPEELIKEIDKEHVVPEEEPAEEPDLTIPEEPKKKGFFKRIFGKKEEPAEEPEETVEPEPEPVEEPVKEELVEKTSEEKPVKPVEEPPVEEKKGIFTKLKDSVTKKAISDEKFEELFWDLEIVLLENNVAVEVIEKIKSDLKAKLVDQKVLRGKIAEIISETLQESINGLFIDEGKDLLQLVKQKKPFVILFLGVNGSGKTTNLAKIAHYLKENGVSSVMAACDTFRAAAIQQIEEHSKKLDIKLIKHEYGSDAAAVAFDAIKHAEAKGKDVVLIDTAGRSHANVNLMDELKKLVRVANPDLKVFVGDSLTGNDAVHQAKSFNDAVGIDGIVLTKVDVDEKGGAAVSVSYVTRKPIYFIGTGQTYADLKKFDSKVVMENLGLV